MAKRKEPTCRLVRQGATFEGKQALGTYFSGISAHTAGAQGICLHMLTIPPGTRGRAHLHEGHETAIYTVSGTVHMWYGDQLREHMVSTGGDFVYIPAGCPHLPMNLSDEPAVCIIARTDSSEQESVKLLPELEALVDQRRLDHAA